MRLKSLKPIVGSLIACAMLGFATSNAHAEEIVVQNDNVAIGGSGNVQAGFVAGERAAAWLTMPCDGTIVAVQMAWRSFGGNTGQTLGDNITLSQPGSFPAPGTDLLFLGGPVLADGFLNEFRYTDEQNTMPISVPVLQGQVIVASFQFLETPGINGASVVTDIGGCQTPKNSLFAIPGGWLNSCALGVSGDFVIRVVIDCEEIGACCVGIGNCSENVSGAECDSLGGVFQGNGSTCAACPQPGACCLPSGVCTVLLQSQCQTNGGTFQGAGTTCGRVNCPQPTGACCFGPGSCVNLNEANCAVAEGEWGGAGTNCAAFICFPEGACCMPDGSCAEMTPEACSADGGAYQGDEVLCGEVSCPLPSGACCLSNGNCLFLVEADCLQIPNASWAGAGTFCADNNMNGIPDGCEGPGACIGDIVSSGTFQPPPDGIVDGADLGFLLTEWGKNPGSPADLVTSGTFMPPPDGKVDGADLGVLLQGWGPCR